MTISIMYKVNNFFGCLIILKQIKANILSIKLNLPQMYNFMFGQFCKTQCSSDETQLQTWS
jgi:hypothetical protein